MNCRRYGDNIIIIVKDQNGKGVMLIEKVTIAYEVSIDQQYGYGVCCKLVLKYYDYILLLLFIVKEGCSFVCLVNW